MCGCVLRAVYLLQSFVYASSLSDQVRWRSSHLYVSHFYISFYTHSRPHTPELMHIVLLLVPKYQGLWIWKKNACLTFGDMHRFWNSELHHQKCSSMCEKIYFDLPLFLCFLQYLYLAHNHLQLFPYLCWNVGEM